MPRLCVLIVDLLGVVCVKTRVFYTARKNIISVVDKSRCFTTFFTKLFLWFFHAPQEFFQSVNHYLLPIINKANKDNDKVYINNLLIGG